MKPKHMLIILILLGTYIGPYLFVYGRTVTWTFPRVDDRDMKAFDKVDVTLDQAVFHKETVTVSGAQRAIYNVDVNVAHRKFVDWIGFPLVLEVNEFKFEAIGVYQGTVAMECNHFETALEQPPGVIPWWQYQPLVDKNDNNTLTVTCSGDASLINLGTLPQNITFNWSVEAILVGDRNEATRTWSNSETVEVRQ